MLHNEFKLDTHDLGLARYQAASRLLIGGAEPPNQHTLKCIEEMMLNPGVACLYKLSIFRIASWRCPSILVDEIAPTILNDLYKCRESETMLLSSIEGNETHSSPEPEMKTHSDGNWLAGYLTKLPVWAECLEKAKRRVASQEKIDWLDMEIILREKNGAELLELLKLIQSSDANRVTLRKAILDELNKRGWRFKSPPKWRRFLFWRDQIKVLRAGD